jgi:hypothetical protein
MSILLSDYMQKNIKYSSDAGWPKFSQVQHFSLYPLSFVVYRSSAFVIGSSNSVA